jgi:glycosyl transferase family 25
MLSIKLQGGLGNWLFQIAAGEHIAKQTRRDFFISQFIEKSHHSKEDYFTSILQNFSHLRKNVDDNSLSHHYEQDIFKYLDWNNFLNPKTHMYCLTGYFQHYKYIPNDFIQKLVFNKSITEKYSNLNTSAFIHVRGTDYKDNPVHDVKLISYYERAIKEFPDGTHFYVFTNDEEYAKTLLSLKNIPHTFIRENEIDSLYLMSQCGSGCICANSSYSWWGAFLNPNRKIIMPDKWYNNLSAYTEGYYFSNVIRISTNLDWNFIDKVVYINLDERKDRNEHMKHVTSCFSEKVTRFSAIKDTPGSIGCMKSHIGVLELAIQNKWKNLLVLEDDAVWNRLHEGYITLRELSSNEYDVIVLGGTCVKRDGNKLISCKTTVGYLINSHYYSTLLENFKEGLESLKQTHDVEMYAVDAYWQRLQSRDNWFILYPCLIYQRSDYSNICNSFQDYKSFFEMN